MQVSNLVSVLVGTVMSGEAFSLFFLRTYSGEWYDAKGLSNLFSAEV